MTGRELVAASLRLIGVKASGESLTADEAMDGLATLNQLIASWSTERLLIHVKVREEFDLTAGVQQYTLGDGADFDTDRPMRIEAALIRDESQSPAFEYPLRLLSFSEWAAIRQKELGNARPESLFSEGTFPNETLNLHPKPDAAYKLVLWSWKPLASVETIDSEIAFPPGYDRALRYNLALELAPEYGRAVPDAVAINAVEAKANIKRMNHRPSYLRVDDIPAGRPNAFNIQSGDCH